MESRHSIKAYLASGYFYEAFFEFITIYMILYVQMASPITMESADTYASMLLAVTIGMIVCKACGGLSYLVFGHLFEYGRFRFGRFRTLIGLGTLCSSLAFLAIFFLAPLATGWAYVVLFLIFFLLLEISFAANDVAYWTYLSTLSRDETKRGMYSTVLNGLTVMGCYTVVSLSPAILAGEAKRNMMILGLALVGCFLSSIAVLCFFMKDVSIDNRSKPHPKLPISSALRTLFSDREIAIAILGFLLLFISQTCFIGNSSNYFYFEFGYGSLGEQGLEGGPSGGTVSFWFGIAFGIGNAISSFIYTPLMKIKGMNKKRLEIGSLCLLVPVYLFYFFFAGRIGHAVSLAVSAGLIALFHGLIYDCLFINCFDLTEYDRYRHSQDRTGVIQALRSSMATFAGAFQTAIYYLFLLVSGYLPSSTAMASLEARRAAGEEIPDFIRTVNTAIQTSKQADSADIYLLSITILPMLFTLLAVLGTLFFVSVNDEKMYQTYLDENRKAE